MNNKKEVSNSKKIEININTAVSNSKTAVILNDYFPNILTSLKLLEFENIHNLSEFHI